MTKAERDYITEKIEQFEKWAAEERTEADRETDPDVRAEYRLEARLNETSANTLRNLLIDVEDTGLEPEKIEAVKAAKTVVVDLALDGDSDDVKHLRELLKAKQDGRLVVLPCKVGDMVYRVEDRKGAPRVASYEVEKIEIHRSGVMLFFHWSGGMYEGVDTEYVGKIIFLTREEAESALAERERGSDK